MKNIKELSHAETIALTNEQLDNMIDYECAEQGIKLLKAIDSPSKPEIKHDKKLYFIGEYYSEDRNVIEEIVELLNKHGEKFVSTNYDYNVGYDYKYCKKRLDVEFSINSMPSLSLNKYDEVKNSLKKYEEEKKTWESQNKLFEENRRGRAAIVDDIMYLYNNHKAAEYKLNAAIQEFDKYLNLAENNKEIAWRFFSKAYPHGYCDYSKWIYYKIAEKHNIVFGEKPENEPNIFDKIEE